MEKILYYYNKYNMVINLLISFFIYHVIKLYVAYNLIKYSPGTGAIQYQKYPWMHDQLVIVFLTALILVPPILFLQFLYPINDKMVGLIKGELKNTLRLATSGVIALSLISFPYKNILTKQISNDPFYLSLDKGKYFVIIQIIIICAAGPFLEEILYRGFYQRLIMEKYGKYFGYGISTFVFSMAHGFALYSIVNSIILCAVYDKSRKVGSSIIAHSASNLSWYLGILIVDIFG